MLTSLGREWLLLILFYSVVALYAPFLFNCWGPFSNPLKTSCPVVLPLLFLVCHGMLNNYSVD